MAPRPSAAVPQAVSEGGQRDYIVFQEWEGMSTQAARHALPEKKLAWLENLQPIGANNLKTVGAPAATLQTITGVTIARQYFAPINGTNYQISFCTNGSAYATNLASGSTTDFAPSGTFSSTPDMTVWNNQRILIADPTAGYATWDETLLVLQGGVSPAITVTAGGIGYTTGATVAISGGSGSGATATATVVGGGVTAIVLTNAGTGYKAGDTLTVTITAVSAGSGATATAIVWPFISPAPNTIAVFEGRVFMASGRILTYTGTQGYSDVNPANAAGTFTISDSDLINKVTALRALNDYLYVLGDNSVKQISTLTVSGSTTSFTLTTLSSDQGTTFINSVVSYNRLLLFSNTVGVYAVFGSSVEKISDDMDGVFQAVNFSQEPVSAVNDINNIHTYLLLVKYNDPVAGPRSIILSYMNRKWFVISQGNNLSFITTCVINGVTETFATSGNDITQIIENDNGNVNITVRTALSAHGNPVIRKSLIRFAAAQTVTQSNTINFLAESENGGNPYTYNAISSVQWINNAGGLVQWQNNSGANVNFTGQGFVYAFATANAAGVYLGATLTGLVAHYSLNMIALEYETANLFGSVPPQ